MTGPRIALWGTFDVDNYGDHVFPRVAVHELRRRLPGAAVDVFAPYGWLHPTRLDDGIRVSPLGAWSPERAGWLASAYDAVVVGGGEIIHLNDPLLAPVYGVDPAEITHRAPSRFFVEAVGPEPERRCPVAWNAVGVSVEPAGEQAQRLRAALARRRYVAVRDRCSAERLRRAGVERDIAVVPDSALLLDRVLPPGVVRRRLERLRADGAYPPGPALAVQGCDLLMPHLHGIADALRHWVAAQPRPLDVLALETGRCRGDTAFAAALVERLAPARVWRLPPSSGVEDLAAAVAGAGVFVGSSLHGAITALVYGRPFVLMNLAAESKLDGFADLTGLEACVAHDVAALPAVLDHAVAGPAGGALLPGLQRRIDDHFDRIADLAARRRPRVAREG